jgi:hypothetical protein
MPAPQRFRGAFLRAGSRYRIWRHYHDVYRTERIFAYRVPDAGVVRNPALDGCLDRPLPVDELPAYWFAPVPFRLDRAAAVPVACMMTGGRTFSLPGPVATALGLPARLHLDLAKAGWGTGLLELLPEVKGAGTRFTRTRLRRGARGAAAAIADRQAAPRWPAAFARASDPLFASLNTYEGRPIGAQGLAHGVHAVQVSGLMLGRSPVRVAPSLLCAPGPDEYRLWLTEVTRARRRPAESAPLFDGSLCTELRYTPGHVRAAYFDTAASGRDLVALCRAVSADRAVLRRTLAALVADARRYIEALCAQTMPVAAPQCIVWPKFGDIHIVFRRDAFGYPAFADEYKFRKRAAWYIAKDEIVVGGLGKVYVDAESIAPTFASADEEELVWHHDLYLLNVLRDHARVAAKFRIGLELLAGRGGRGAPSLSAPAAAYVDAILGLVASSRESSLYRLEPRRDGVTIAVRYPRLGTARDYHYPYEQILGRSIRPI